MNNPDTVLESIEDLRSQVNLTLQRIGYDDPNLTQMIHVLDEIEKQTLTGGERSKGKRRCVYDLKGFTKQEEIFIDQVLQDPRGWSKTTDFIRSQRSTIPVQVVCHKTPRKVMEVKYPHVHLAGLSVCDRGLNPIEIHFDQQNWEQKTENFTGSLKQYRQYLVQHEFGHAIGHDHQADSGSGTPCHPMYQQSKGGSCDPNPWIDRIDSERPEELCAGG